VGCNEALMSDLSNNYGEDTVNEGREDLTCPILTNN